MPGKKRASEKTLTGRADRAFSIYIRQRDGTCQIQHEGCEGTNNLQCCHGFSRRYHAIRWDERNAFAGCRTCHMYHTAHPEEWYCWLAERWGDELYTEMLRLREQTRPRPDKQAIAADYKARVFGGTR